MKANKKFIASALTFALIIIAFISLTSSVSKRSKKPNEVQKPVAVDTSNIGNGNLDERISTLEKAVLELARMSEENSDYIYAMLIEEGKLRAGSYDNLAATTFAVIDGLEQIKITLKEPVYGSNTRVMAGELPEESRIK